MQDLEAGPKIALTRRTRPLETYLPTFTLCHHSCSKFELTKPIQLDIHIYRSYRIDCKSMSPEHKKCTHLAQVASLQPPKLSQSVHREECTQCFDDQDTSLGISVCLVCFNGGCLSTERHHAQTHWKKTGHLFSIDVKRIRKEKDEKSVSQRASFKVSHSLISLLTSFRQKDLNRHSK